jgi:hypothetical protein
MVTVLMLGPYRSLTTLTAAALHLHPHVQVLNHHYMHIFDTLHDPILFPNSQEKFQAYALKASVGGQRGDAGGSILLSHAFDKSYPTRERYLTRYGGDGAKDDVQCMVWKESYRIGERIRRLDKFDALVQAGVKFIAPLRNPIHCARSNLKTNHHRLLGTNDRDGVIRKVLEEYNWILNKQRQYPDAVCLFPETDYLAAFDHFLKITGLPDDAQWRADLTACAQINPKPAVTGEELDVASQIIDELYTDQILIRTLLGDTSSPDTREHSPQV